MENNKSIPAAVSEGNGSLSHRKKRFARTAIKFIVSGLLIVWLLQSVSVTEIFAAMSSANVYLLLAAFSLYFVSYYINAYRWRILIAVHGVKAPIPYLVKSYMSAIFFSNFLPSTIGGDVLLVHDSSLLLNSKTKAVVVVFMCRFLGIMALFFLALTALMLSWDLAVKFPYLYMGIIVGAVGGIVGTWVIFAPSNWLVDMFSHMQVPYLKKLQALPLLQNVSQAFYAFQGQTQALSWSLALSFCLQTSVVVHYYLVGQALGFSVDFQNYFLIIPLALVMIMMPFSINGIGLREYAFVFLFSLFGVTEPEAVALAWITYGMVILQGLIGGVVYSLRQ